MGLPFKCFCLFSVSEATVGKRICFQMKWYICRTREILSSSSEHTTTPLLCRSLPRNLLWAGTVRVGYCDFYCVCSCVTLGCSWWLTGSVRCSGTNLKCYSHQKLENRSAAQLAVSLGTHPQLMGEKEVICGNHLLNCNRIRSYCWKEDL